MRRPSQSVKHMSMKHTFASRLPLQYTARDKWKVVLLSLINCWGWGDRFVCVYRARRMKQHKISGSY